MASKVQRIKTPAPTLQLHIELRHLKPKIWRRVLVPETITLQRLHGVIQAAFQWGGGHMHEFTAAGERYGSSDPDYDTPGSMHSEATRLTKAATAAGTIDYVYDFGDYWEHRIKIEKVLAPADMKLPVCIAGANAAPPDDCGGVPGYADFVQAMSDPTHPEHADMKEWIGRDWDPYAFDIAHINSWLSEIKL
jgi:Plasmid pRiA4b ORF-3-like protein